MIATIPYQPLTPCQMQVAALWADTDLTPLQIGGQLGLHKRTVENAVHQLYRALRVHSRPALRSVMLTYELAPVGGAR